MTTSETLSLAQAAAKLANSLVEKRPYGRICSRCHMGTLGPDEDLHHAASCVVGQVLDQARRANQAEEDFFRVEGRSDGQPAGQPVGLRVMEA